MADTHNPSTAPLLLQALNGPDTGEAGLAALDVARAAKGAAWRAAAVGVLAGGKLDHGMARAGAERLPWRAGWGLTGPFSPAGVKLAALATERGASWLHAAGPSLHAAVAAGAKRAGLGYSLAWPDVCSFEGQPSAKHAAALEGAAKVIVPSEHARGRAWATGADEARIEVIKPAIDGAVFDPAAVRGHRVAALAERWGVSPAAKVVLLPGSIDADGGHAQALEALFRCSDRGFVLLVEDDPDLHPDQARRLEAVARQAGLAERLRFAGRTGERDEDGPAACLLADVVLLFENDPLSPRTSAQAQAMGRPVVACGGGALAETVRECATGWSVARGDQASLASAMNQALELDKEAKANLGARARAYALREHGLRVIQAKLDMLFSELLGVAASKAGLYPDAAGSAQG